MPYFSPDHLTEIQEKLDSLESSYSHLLIALHNHCFKNEKAREYATHGFLRRFGTLRRCVENVFSLIPPETEIIPNSHVLYDAAINIQAFFANVYGSLDNLAWIWVYERDLKIDRKRVGLRIQCTELRSTFSRTFEGYLKDCDDWMDHVIEYRDALAHRIPLYVPPGVVSTRNANGYNDLTLRMNEALYVRSNLSMYEELSAVQEKLLIFQPVITHSITETKAHYPFHFQMIADFLTVEEFAKKMLDELKLFGS